MLPGVGSEFLQVVISPRRAALFLAGLCALSDVLIVTASESCRGKYVLLCGISTDLPR